jgi:hypothetical protein
MAKLRAATDDNGARPPTTDYHTIVTQPGGDSGGGPGNNGATHPTQPVCVWVPGGSTELDAIIRDSGASGQMIRETADDHILLVYRCEGAWDGRTWRWVIPVTAAELARDALVEISGVLPSPQPQTTPPAGRASIASVAVLVWTDPATWAQIHVSRSDPLTGLTATVSAQPRTLRFDPGDGTAPVTCDPPGVAYDPQLADGDANTQAQMPGRCAHAYTLVTRNADGSAVAGRPAAWTARLSVGWDVSWTATNGETGRFAVITKSATFERPVTEVQVLVTG